MDVLYRDVGLLGKEGPAQLLRMPVRLEHSTGASILWLVIWQEFPHVLALAVNAPAAQYQPVWNT